MAYQHGKFVWFTLYTQDVDRAKAFYGELFGWTTDEMPMPDGTYFVFKNGEVPVGGTRAPQDNKAPAHWQSYLSVADVDGKAKEVHAAGGKVMVKPHDIPTVGREAIVSDPHGAVLALFKSAEGDPEPPKGSGNWHWNELWSQDAKGAAEFYAKLVGYETKTMDMPTGPYHVLEESGTPCGGVMASPDANIPPMWLGYVHVDDADETARRAKELGASLMGDVMTLPGVGRFGMMKDPTGAAVAFITPAAA